MTKSFALYALGLACAPALAYTPYVPMSTTLYDGGVEYKSSLSYFGSTSRVNTDGELVDFSGGESFSMIDVNLLGSYGLTDSLQVSGGISLGHNMSTSLYLGDEYSQTTTGLKRGLIGLKYAFPDQDGWQISLEVNYEPALYTNKDFDGGEPKDLVLGDDGSSTSFGAAMTWMSGSRNYISGRVLYRNPSSTLSSEIFSEIEGVLAWDRVALLAGVENNTSLGQDPYTGDPSLKPPIDSGSTFLFNSVNRSWTAPYAGINFALDKLWRLEIKGGTRISGTSTDLGNTFLVTLARRDSEAKTFQKKDSAFKEYSVEATVVKVGKSGNLVVIDAGIGDGLNKGSKIDFYHFDYVGGNELIAAGLVVKAGAGKSIVRIAKRYAKKKVEDGTLAKGGLIGSTP